MKKKSLIFPFSFLILVFFLFFTFSSFVNHQPPHFVAQKGLKKRKFYCSNLCDKEIKEAIDFLRDGGKIVFSEGEFLFSNSVSENCAIELSSKISLLGKGQKTVLKLKEKTNSDFSLICTSKENNEKILLKNFKIVGNAQNQEDSFIQIGLFLKNLNKSKIEGITIENFLKEGLFCSNCKENQFLKNTIKDNQGTGFYLSESSKNEIFQNKIINNDFGLFLSLSDENKISKNEIAFNFADGIYLENSSRNLISENKILENGKEKSFGSFDGIRLYQSSNENKILKNEISDSKGDGFLINIFEDCKGNIVEKNLFSGNVKFIQNLGQETKIEQ